MPRHQVSRLSRLRLAQQLAIEHPDWSGTRLLREIRRVSGRGLRWQDILDIRRATIGTMAPTLKAKERESTIIRVIQLSPIAAKKPLRIPKQIIFSSPRVKHDDKRFSRYVSSVVRMPFPHLPHRIFVDLEFPRVIGSSGKHSKPSEYKTVILGEFTRDEFARLARSGSLPALIRDRVKSLLNVRYVPAYATLGYWASRDPIV